MAVQTTCSDEKAEWGSGFEWEIKGAGVEEVWAVTGDFLGADKWAPKLVQRCELVEGEAQKVGCVRKVVLFPMAPGDPFTFVIEKLLSIDPLSHSFSYTILGGGTMPGFSLMDHYVSSFKLSPLEGHENGTLLQWSYVCRPVSTLSREQTSNIAFSLYQTAVGALKERLSLPDDCVTLSPKHPKCGQIPLSPKHP